MDDFAERIKHVVDDREHGSRWLMQEAIALLRDMARHDQLPVDEHLRMLYRAAYEIAQARPAMAALANAVSRVISVHEQGPGEIAHEATRLLQELETATEHIASHAQSLVCGHVMTCSLSGTVVDVLLARHNEIEQVTVLEGRPRYEGRAMARILSEHGMAVSLITDAQADIFLPLCQAVVVGADSILINGDVLNKAGTALIARAARDYSVPVYVLCETLKISPHRWHEHDPARFNENLALLEEKEPEEVLPQAIPGVRVRNFYFDRTPYKLVHNVITNQGIIDRRHIREIAVEARAHQRVLKQLQK